MERKPKRETLAGATRRIIERFNQVTGANVKTVQELNDYADEHPEVFPKLGLPTPKTLARLTKITDDMDVQDEPTFPPE